MTLNARLARATRRHADALSGRFSSLPVARLLRADVVGVAAGASTDGRAVVTVRWRGAELVVADYPDSYTPAVGHRVLCVLADHQLSILHRGVGFP